MEAIRTTRSCRSGAPAPTRRQGQVSDSGTAFRSRRHDRNGGPAAARGCRPLATLRLGLRACPRPRKHRFRGCCKTTTWSPRRNRPAFAAAGVPAGERAGDLLSADSRARPIANWDPVGCKRRREKRESVAAPQRRTQTRASACEELCDCHWQRRPTIGRRRRRRRHRGRGACRLSRATRSLSATCPARPASRR
jgi:hypothetical protein